MKNKTKQITVSAVLLAVATVLSIFPKIDIVANGGSITVCSMLPIILISYFYGIKWGILSSVTYGMLQLMLEAALPPANNLFAVILCIILEYIIAFGILGFGGIFKGKLNSTSAELIAGVILTLSIRFLCHFVAGAIIWGSIIDFGSWQYSLFYNGSYMLPEVIITSMGAFAVGKALPTQSLIN